MDFAEFCTFFYEGVITWMENKHGAVPGVRGGGTEQYEQSGVIKERGRIFDAIVRILKAIGSKSRVFSKGNCMTGFIF